MTADEIAFMAAGAGAVADSGHEGIRVTPNNLVAAGELVKQDQAHAYPNGFGYLCLRAACENKNAAGLEMICPAGAPCSQLAMQFQPELPLHYSCQGAFA